MFFSHNFVAHVGPRSRNLRKKFSKGTHVNSKSFFLGNLNVAMDHKYFGDFILWLCLNFCKYVWQTSDRQVASKCCFLWKMASLIVGQTNNGFIVWTETKWSNERITVTTQTRAFGKQFLHFRPPFGKPDSISGRKARKILTEFLSNCFSTFPVLIKSKWHVVKSFNRH